MGVEGLRTYLKCYCPNACYRVHLPDLISKEWRESKCRPVIVVDAPSCYSMWCRGINWTIGLEVQELIHRLRSFVETFDDMGAQLVFFVGGLTPQKKRKTWLRREIDSIRNMMDVFDLLYASKTYEDIPERLDSVPSNVGNFVAFVLKHVLNCTVHVSVGDCDEEIINYVHENDSFAIFAFDTDFVVSLVHCIVLDADTYDCDKKTTVLYDPEVLCKYLRLEEDQLPLLAVLAGNDLIYHEILKPFHFRICNWSPKNPQIPYKMLMESIATYIHGLPRRSRLSTKMMERICVDVFGDGRRVNDMMAAYRSYIPNPTSDITGDSLWSRILKMAKIRIQTVLLPVFVWGILNEQFYESPVCFEDLREINDCNDDIRNCPSATITRRLRRRFYGILLYEKRDGNKLVVEEWCAENTDSYRRPVEVKPEYPKVHHPGLKALWSSDRNSAHHRNKWRLFLGAVSPCIDNFADWMSLPEDMVVSAAACYYLYYEKHFLEKWELNAILITSALFSYYGRFFLNAVRQAKDSQQSFRAIQISITFSCTYNLVFSLMASCGFPVPLSKDTAFIKFEPVLFQMIYKQVKNRASLEQICNNNEHVLRIFEQMDNTIRG